MSSPIKGPCNRDPNRTSRSVGVSIQPTCGSAAFDSAILVGGILVGDEVTITLDVQFVKA